MTVPNSAVCATCQMALETPLFCFACETLQPLKTKPDYFAIFGIAPTYTVDLAYLDGCYEKQAAALHPDFYENAAADEKKQSEVSAALLNMAYEVLKNPSDRAHLLLRYFLKTPHLENRQLPPAFLQEMFELQEALEALLDEGQQRTLEKFQADIAARLQQNVAAYTQLFVEFETQSPTSSELLLAIQVHLNVERYLKRLLDRCSSNLETHRCLRNDKTNPQNIWTS